MLSDSNLCHVSNRNDIAARSVVIVSSSMQYWHLRTCVVTSVPHEQLLQTEEYDLNVVRLCIQVFLQDEAGQYTRQLNPIVTNPIYDNSEWTEPMPCCAITSKQDVVKSPDDCSYGNSSCMTKGVSTLELISRASADFFYWRGWQILMIFYSLMSHKIK